MCLTQELKQLSGKFYQASSLILSCQQLLGPITFDFDSLERNQFNLLPHHSIHHLRFMACLQLFRCSQQTSLFKPFKPISYL